MASRPAQPKTAQESGRKCTEKTSAAREKIRDGLVDVMKVGTEWDGSLHERLTQCTTSTKLPMPPSSREPNEESKKPSPLSSKIEVPQARSAGGFSKTSKPLPLTNSAKLSKQPFPIATFHRGRLLIDPRVFQEQQKTLAARGAPEDPCGECGCRRKYHLPKPTFSYAKSGGSSGRSIELNCLAPTSCECKYCLCACVAFIEPFEGQRSARCVYEPEL
jgi:hypothetical protein